MNLSGISRSTWVGRALRVPLRFIPPRTVLPVLQGRLRGTKWIVGSGVHGYWIGSYEWEKRLLFEKTVPEGAVVFDAGAHVGFYTLLASILVGSKGRVFAFEPVPRNLHFLEAHIRLNGVSNVSVVDVALSGRSEEVRFEESRDSSMGHLQPDGNLPVRAAALDDLVASGDVPLPDYVKMDIEGAEAEALRGARATLEKARPSILLATHGRDLHNECMSLLLELGYEVRPARSSEGRVSSDLLATHPARGATTP